MDSLPIFLKLLKSSSLICAFLTTGDLEAVNRNYDGECFYFSENSMILKAFKFDSLEAFEYIQITQIDSCSRTILFVANNSEYFNNRSYYFGEKTIYSRFMDQIKEKGLVLPNENRYCFPFLSQKARISLIGETLISLDFGEDICENY